MKPGTAKDVIRGVDSGPRSETFCLSILSTQSREMEAESNLRRTWMVYSTPSQVCRHYARLPFTWACYVANVSQGLTK